MRRLIACGAVLLAVGLFMVIAGGAARFGSKGTHYYVQLDNAFGLTPGAAFKVAGVPAGKIDNVFLAPGCVGSSNTPGDPHQCKALAKISITQNGFGPFHADDVSCRTRPQGLIGEYFVECQPGTKGPVLKSGALIPVSHTESTIPADLLTNIMRLPYRQRLTLIINELGAAVAGRSGDLEAALKRAVPAITQTDNLLNLLANDSNTIQALTTDANSVITELANNRTKVQNFIDEANSASLHSAAQAPSISATWHQLPGFLEQLRPTLAQLGGATDANLPVLRNLNAGAGEIARLFRDLPPFVCGSNTACPPHPPPGNPGAALVSLRALGSASVPGRQAVIAAQPLVAHLNNFARPTPELAQNLAIVLRDLDDRGRAVEANTRSPGGRGYTGLEALLQYVFNQTLAINYFGPLGHLLAVDAFFDPLCTPYASPQTAAQNLALAGSQYRRCYSWLGPNQPGVNETDPTNPGACVPDPGGAPPGQRGPRTSACKLSPTSGGASSVLGPANVSANPANAPATNAPAATTASKTNTLNRAGPPPPGGKAPPLAQPVGKAMARQAGGGASGSGSSSGTSGGSGSGGSGSGGSGSNGSGGSGGQAQQLLNYLLAP